jgi:hypothetical protein
VDERQWLECTDPQKMLELLEDEASERKLRLFAVACCRRIWHLLTDKKSRRSVEIAEAYADRQASSKEVRAVRQAMRALHDSDHGRPSHLDCALHAASYACRRRADLLKVSSMAAQAAFYDPDSARGDGTVRRLAQATYDERQLPSGTLDPARLAVLADALEEAGCDDPAILDHLRCVGPHFRGCFVLDAILAKE